MGSTSSTGTPLARPRVFTPSVPNAPAPTVPHLAWPLALTKNGQVATVEQDIPEHVAQCVDLLLTVHPGDLIDNPAFGSPPLEFTTGQVDQAVQVAVRKWEPRATDAQITDAGVRQRARALTVDLNTTGGASLG